MFSSLKTDLNHLVRIEDCGNVSNRVGESGGCPCDLGIFIQWDWLATGNDRDFGLSEEEILSTYNNVGFKLLSLDKVFSLESSEGEMPVIMGMAKKK